MILKSAFFCITESSLRCSKEHFTSLAISRLGHFAADFLSTISEAHPHIATLKHLPTQDKGSILLALKHMYEQPTARLTAFLLCSYNSWGAGFKI